MRNYWLLTRRNLILFGALPMLAGLLIGIQGWFWYRNSASFVENLQEAEARVRRIVPGAGDLLMDIEYQDANGVTYAQQYPVDSASATQYRAIGKVSVVFDRRDPRKAEMGHIVSANNEMAVDLGVVGLGLLLVVGGLFYVGRRERQIAGIRQLFRSGHIIQTEVRDVAMAPGKTEGRFTYAFRGPNGRWFEGKSPELPAVQLAGWPVGKSITVAYDPREPRNSEVDIFGMMEKRRDRALTA